MSTKELNIVLVGETGVGKSTFMNAFVNYLKFENLKSASNSKEIHCLIPCRFTITDENFDDQVIKFGDDQNECRNAGASSTQQPRSYIFSFNGINVRLIDTPGIGRGMSKDEENFDKVLLALGELQSVHALCILLKPNSARLSVLFEYCIKELLSRLDKSASQNVVFVLTNSRSTFYKPGETSAAVKALLSNLKEKPPFVNIPFCKDNVFCMDNEAFRFLLAKRQNIPFTQLEENDFATSWDKSADVCTALICYIDNLPPHRIQHTLSVNEARRMILHLSEPLVEIMKNIDDNLKIIKRKHNELSDENKSTEDLKKLLYYDIIKLNVKELHHPMTVRTDSSCIETYGVNGVTQINYKQVCHAQKEQLMTKIKELIEKTTREKEEIEEEKEFVQNSMAKFANFLRNNPIIRYNDKYQDYITYLIEQEESRGAEKDLEKIRSYNNMIAIHKEQQKILDDQLNSAKEKNSEAYVISAKDVLDLTNKLCSLKRYGRVIKQYYDSQQRHYKQENLLFHEKNIDGHWFDSLRKGYNKIKNYASNV